MFSKLFEILPDAEELLSLEPEELAGPLLISLEDDDAINPNEIIGSRTLARTIKRHSHPINYPYRSHNKVLLALMEAWQWLEREGLVAPEPKELTDSTNFSDDIYYFITRRGKSIQTSENFETYLKTNLLPKRQLHPIIAQKVWSAFLQGNYDNAVFQAFKQVEVAVRKAGGYTEKDYGKNLMSKAFQAEKGDLTDTNQPESEREARYFLFAGAIGAYKNPSSHRDVEITAEEAAEIITFASHLLRIVDSCKQPEAKRGI